MMDYTPFWNTLRTRGVTTYALIYKHGVSNGTLYRIRKNKPLNTTTINDLCRILDCRVEDIVRYLPDQDEQA